MSTNVSIGNIYGYKSKKMTDHVIVKVIDSFFEKCRIEVIDHRGNIHQFPFFEKLVLKTDLRDFTSLGSQDAADNDYAQHREHFLLRIELTHLHFAILQNFINSLLNSFGKRPKDLFFKSFGTPFDLDQIKNTITIDNKLGKNIGTSTIITVNSILTQIHQKMIELSLMDEISLADYAPISERCRKLILNETQVQLCRLFLSHQLEMRDKRVNDLFIKYFGESLNVSDILSCSTIDSGEQKFLIGKRTVDEANRVLEELQNKALAIAVMSANQIRTTLLFYHLNAVGYEVGEFSEQEFVEINGETNFLQLLSLLVQSSIFFKPNQIAICNAFFLNDEEITLDELGKQLGVTRERVRQIKWSLYETFPQLIEKSFYPFYLAECRDLLLREGETDLVILSGESLDKINDANNVVLGRLGYIVLYESILPNHELIGLDTISTNPKPNFNVQNRYLNLYFVHKRFFAWIDFRAFMDHLYDKLSRARFTQTLTQTDFLVPFLKKKIEDKGSISILEKILSEEFEIKFEDNQVIIPGTKQSSLLHLEAILRDAGRPMKLDEIYTLVLTNGVELAKNTVHAYLIENKDKFSLVGLSTFAHVSQNMKPGMLADLVEEYLTQEGKPKKIDNIFKEVQKHRKTVRQNALRSNCANLPKRFLVKGSVIGLRGRDTVNDLEKADPQYISREEKWEQNYRNIVDFLKGKRRVPSPHRGTSERSLYNFISFNKRIFNRLSEERQKKITTILKLYPAKSFPKYLDDDNDDWSSDQNDFTSNY